MGKFRHKKWILIFSIIMLFAIISITFVVFPYSKTLNENSDGTEIISNEVNFCENPYRYITEYMPEQVLSIQTQEGYINFQQISNIDEDTDKIIDFVYSEFSVNLSEGIKDCFCEFDEEGNVFFSRISEDDYDRYQGYRDYVGDKGAEILFNLENIPEHRYEATGCVTFQKDAEVELALLSTTLYSNVTVNVLMSKDFSRVEAISENNEYKELIKVLNSEYVSKISGIDMANIYHYRKRIFKLEEDNVTEEQFVYYSYFILDQMEYIVQFTSNYTVLEGQNEYMMVSDLHSQEECRNTLLSVLKTIIDNTTLEN